MSPVSLSPAGCARSTLRSGRQEGEEDEGRAFSVAELPLPRSFTARSTYRDEYSTMGPLGLDPAGCARSTLRSRRQEGEEDEGRAFSVAELPLPRSFTARSTYRDEYSTEATACSSSISCGGLRAFAV